MDRMLVQCTFCYRLYKKAASQLGFDEAHLHLRPKLLESDFQRKSVAANPTTLSSYAVVDVMADK